MGVAGGLAYSSDVTLRSRLGMNIWPDGGKSQIVNQRR